ncbi:MAG TPA: hypothetical protein VM242_15360 [Acidimicrobiales bacterium]|jgi:hypothetical protein|nr:hypothetical protein [Acidimicrobiales bacterium]
MDEERIRRLQADHERLKKNPNIRIFGEPPGGRPNVTERFARSLAELTPTRRRLALARACAQPWRNDAEAMPECYQRDLVLAAYEAGQEHATCCADFDVDAMFVEDPEPISPLLLRQLAELSPTHRRERLTSVLSSPWSGPIPEKWRHLVESGRIEWGDPSEPPEWLQREHEYRHAENFDDRKHWGAVPSATPIPPEDGARQLEDELNRG